MSLKSILNAFGDVTVSTIEENSVLKAQLGNALRVFAFWLSTGFATSGYMTNDHAQMVGGLIVTASLALYSNLKTRAERREKVVVLEHASELQGETVTPSK